MMWWPDGTTMGWWMGFGGVWMVILWGGLIALIVWGISKLGRRDGSAVKRDSLDIAKERYARGEISEEEFNQLKKNLY